MCAAGGVIEWTEIYDLGQQTDEAAYMLNTPGYEPLSQETRNPWPISSTIDATIWQRFTVNLNEDGGKRPSFFPGPTILGRLMAASDGSAFQLPNDPILKNMAEDGNLFFISEEDGCWCKTLFQVVPAYIGGGDNNYTLSTAEDTRGCCQTMEVPMEGDLLEYAQNFIPAGWVVQRQKPTLEKTDNVVREVIPKCVGNEGGVIFEYTKNGESNNGFTEYKLTAVQRELRGKFVWPIKREWFELLFNKISQIIECSNHSGARSRKIKICGCTEDETPEPNEGEDCFVRSGCSVTFADLQRSLLDLWGGNEDPGCLTSCADNCLPWAVGCCGGEQCDDSGLKVYCNTIQHLDSMIGKLQDIFHPWAESTQCPKCCNPCDFSAAASGGVEGFRKTYTIGEDAVSQACSGLFSGSIQYRIILNWDHFTVPDNTCLNGKCTGMRGGSGTLETTVAPGEDIVVTVAGSEDGTAWTFSISCEIQETPPP